MRRRLAMVAAGAVRTVRGVWPDRNPLRRTLDRVEAAILAGLAVAFLAGAPLAAVTAAHVAAAIGTRTAQAQRSWHHVPAVLLADAPRSGGPRYGPVARARWAVPGGRARTGTVSAPPGARAGSTVLVWVDASGNLTKAPPLRLAQVNEQAVLAAVAASVALGYLLPCVGLLACGMLARRRLAAWDADWRATEPRWTRRRRSSG
jgi:Protein of unknown function (DUF3592)